MRHADLQHEEECFEFSFRPGYGTRLFVRVPESSLEVLRRDAGARTTSVAVVNRHAAAICALAEVKGRLEHTAAIVLTPADAESIVAGARPTEQSGSA